jgi:hypothetical protein
VLIWAQELGSTAMMALCLVGIARVLNTQRRVEPATTLVSTSDRLRQVAERHPLYGAQFQTAYAQALVATRAALTPEEFAQAWAAGQALSLDDACDLALAELASMPAATSAATTSGA